MLSDMAVRDVHNIYQPFQPHKLNWFVFQLWVYMRMEKVMEIILFPHPFKMFFFFFAYYHRDVSDILFW